MDYDHYDDPRIGVAVNLVNTVGWPSGNEYLADEDDLRGFLEAHDLPQPRRVTPGDLEALRELRPRLRKVFEAGSIQDAAATLNGLLEEVEARPQLVETEDGWDVRFVPGSSSVRSQVQAAAAIGLMHVVQAHGLARFGICNDANCRDVFVDVSRNRSRRYCNSICSTRTNVAAYRARHNTAK